MLPLLNILMIGDSAADTLSIMQALERGGYTPSFECVDTAEALQTVLEHTSWDVLIAVDTLSSFSALDALAVLKAHSPDIPFIIIASTPGEETAVAAIKAGADDYLMHDNLQRLVPAIEDARHEAEARRERHHAKQMLRESEQRFRAMVEHTTACIALVSTSGTVLYISPAITALAGFTPQECIGRNAFDLVYPADKSYVQSLFDTLLVSLGTTITVEMRYQHRDGCYYWIEATASNCLNQHSIRAIVVNFRDITERKKALEIVRRSEERFARTFHASPVPIAISRLNDGCLLHINRSFLNLVGSSLEQVMGRTSVEFGFWRNVAQRNTIIGAMQQGQPVRGITMQFCNGMGEVRNLLAWIEIIELEGELCTLTMLHDVTERKLAETRQATRLGVTRILAEAATLDAAIPDVLHTICKGFGWHFAEMWCVDTSDHTLRCTYLWHEPQLAESEFATLTPTLVCERGHDLPGQTWQYGQIIWLDDIGNAPQFVRAAAAQQAGLQSAIALPVCIGADFDGVMCFFSYHARCHDEMLSETLTDIGSQISQFLHRKRIEAALVEERASLKQRVAEATLELSRINAELSRALRTKDEFLATMSHELRTPLNAILGMTEAIQEEIYGSINEKQSHALSTVESSGRHLLALINDILDVSKIEAGKVELQFDIIAVETICKASLQFIHQQALQKGIKVIYDRVNAPPTLLADARRLKQILINLLTNAVKFTPAGGQVGLQVAGDPEQDTISFSVWDTGIGIAPKYQQSLFKPFVQIDSSLSKTHQGTGLGLVLVARLTEMHGGSVTLESEDGKGSRFTISLPIGSDSHYALHPCNDNKVVVQNIRIDTGKVILIVEDNEATLEMLRDYLEQYGYRVVVARNGAEAIERVTQMQLHLILMDIQMPGVDGLEAIRRIRATSHCAAIPIIAMTALTMPGDREQCLEAGANNYLSKPISLKTLVSTVQTQLTSVAVSMA